MAVKVLIPTPLRNLTGGNETVEASGTTIAELFADLERLHPGIKERLCDDKGEIRRFVNVHEDAVAGGGRARGEDEPIHLRSLAVGASSDYRRTVFVLAQPFHQHR